MPPSSASKKTPASEAGGLSKGWIKAIRLAEGALEDDDVEFEETIDNVTLTYANGGILWSCHGRKGPVEGVDRDSLTQSILTLLNAGVFEAMPPPAKLTGNDYIALAITKFQLKSDIQKITPNLTSQDLKSYFGEAAAKKHKLWTVSGTGAESKYVLTHAGHERVTVLLKDGALRSKLETASAGVVDGSGDDDDDDDDGDDGDDGDEDAGGEEDEEETAVPIPPVGANVEVLQGLPAPGLKKENLEKLRKALSGEGVQAGESLVEIGLLDGGSHTALAFVAKDRKNKVSLSITVGDDGEGINIPIDDEFDVTLVSVENKIRTELFEFEERRVAVVQGDSFQTDESPSTGTVYSAGEFGDTWKVGAPAVGTAVQLEESGWASHTVSSATPGGKTFKVGDGRLKSVKVSDYGKKWRYKPTTAADDDDDDGGDGAARVELKTYAQGAPRTLPEPRRLFTLSHSPPHLRTLMRAGILDDTCTKMASPMNFALCNHDRPPYRVSIERTKDSAGAPCAAIFYRNDDRMEELKKATITDLKEALETFLGLDSGALCEPEPSSIAVKPRGAVRDPPPKLAAKPAASAKPATRPFMTARKPAAAAAKSEPSSDGPIERAELAMAKIDSVVSEQRSLRFRELRNEMDASVVNLLETDDAELAAMTKRAREQAFAEVPVDPRVQRIKDAKAKLEAAQQAAAAAEAELVALLQEIEGSSSSSSDPPPAKRAKK